MVGGVPGQGVVVEGVKGIKYAPHAARNIEKRQKTGGFLHFLACKLPKMLFFAQKYLTRYTPETFFEEYVNFKIFHYLAIVELYLFKVSEVINAPSRPD